MRITISNIKNKISPLIVKSLGLMMLSFGLTSCVNKERDIVYFSQHIKPTPGAIKTHANKLPQSSPELHLAQVANIAVGHGIIDHTVANGKLYVLDVHAKVIAVDLNTRKILWSKPINAASLPTGGISYGPDGIYVAYGHKVMLMNHSGDVISYVELDDVITEKPLILGQNLYVPTPSGGLYILRPRSFEHIFKMEGGSLGLMSKHPNALGLIDNSLIISEVYGKIMVLDQKTLAIKANHERPKNDLSRPVPMGFGDKPIITSNLMYVCNNLNGIKAINSSGAIVSEANILNVAAWHYNQGIIFLVNQANQVAALSEDLKILWVQNLDPTVPYKYGLGHFPPAKYEPKVKYSHMRSYPGIVSYKGNIILADSIKNIYILNAATGQIKQAIKAPKGLKSFFLYEDKIYGITNQNMVIWQIN